MDGIDFKVPIENASNRDIHFNVRPASRSFYFFTLPLRFSFVQTICAFFMCIFRQSKTIRYMPLVVISSRPISHFVWDIENGYEDILEPFSCMHVDSL